MRNTLFKNISKLTILGYIVAHRRAFSGNDVLIVIEPKGEVSLLGTKAMFFFHTRVDGYGFPHGCSMSVTDFSGAYAMLRQAWLDDGPPFPGMDLAMGGMPAAGMASADALSFDGPLVPEDPPVPVNKDIIFDVDSFKAFFSIVPDSFGMIDPSELNDGSKKGLYTCVAQFPEAILAFMRQQVADRKLEVL